MGVDDEILVRMKGVPTATVCDAFIKTGRGQPERLVARGVRPVTGIAQSAVGRARTQQIVRIRDRAQGSMVTARELHFSLADDASPGDFIVIGVPPGEPFAVIGDVNALRAKQAGVVGMATDGAVRDVGAIVDLGMPVWGADVTMIPAGYGGCSVGAVDVPISCGGAEITPGDLIVADADGVFVIPLDDVDDVVEVCLQMEEAEVRARAAILEGQRLLEVYPSRAYYANKEKS